MRRVINFVKTAVAAGREMRHLWKMSGQAWGNAGRPSRRNPLAPPRPLPPCPVATTWAERQLEDELGPLFDAVFAGIDDADRIRRQQEGM